MKPNNENLENINFKTQAIPTELRALPQWVAWTEKKEPINPKTGIFAKTSDPSTWGTYEEAITCCRQKQLQGIGFVFSDTDPFAGIDLDDSIDTNTGEVSAWAKEIVNQFSSYTEISPSGRGLHILTGEREGRLMIPGGHGPGFGVEPEGQRSGTARLEAGAGQVHGPGVDARRRTRLEAAKGQSQAPQ